MKQFLKRLLYFLAFLFVLFGVLDVLITTQLKKSPQYADGELLVWNDIYNGNLHSDVLIYGSSRAWVHIDPSILDKEMNCNSYNLGVNGHSLPIQLLRHEELVKHNPWPKLIVFSIDIWTLTKRGDLYNYQQFLPYMLFNLNMYRVTSGYEGFSWYHYFLPMFRYFQVKDALTEAMEMAFGSGKTAPARVKGYMGQDKPWDFSFENARKKMEFFEAHPDPETVRSFLSFLDECKKKNVPVVFVYSPEYKEGQSFIKNREEVMTRFRTISDEKRIPFLDYSDNPICLKKEYFYNVQHLNRKGAEIFSKELAMDLIRTGVWPTGAKN